MKEGERDETEKRERKLPNRGRAPFSPAIPSLGTWP